MKKFVVISLFISLCLFSCDKDDISSVQMDHFIKYYTNYPEFTAADVVVTSEGYAVLGTAKSIDGGTWISLIRTDEFGNSIDSARIYGRMEGDIASNTAYCLKALSDGGFAILGSITNPGTNRRAVYFIRTNSVGDTLWTRTIGRTGNVEAKYFEMNQDESFFMTGYCDSFGKGKEIWWFAIDSASRDIRNQRTYGLASDDEGNHLQILPDGRLVITGYITRSGSRRAFVIKTHENTVYADIFELPATGNETGNSISFLDADNFLVLGTSGSAAASGMSLKNIRMSDTEHDVNWSQTYNPSTANVSRSLLMDNQSLYLLGTTSISSSSTSITLITTDLSGNQRSRSDFGMGSGLSASAFKRTSDNGFIIAGTNAHAEENNTSLALIKTAPGPGL
jgi:hypothetical protein